jgi:hypothetical protein
VTPLLLLAVISGCGPTATMSNPTEMPLTVEAWKELPMQVKFEVETFERLKLGNPKLQDPKAWEKFTREVILPAKKGK